MARAPGAGRPPKPTPLRETQSPNPAEPAYPDDGSMVMLPGMSEAAKRVWPAVAKMLHEAGVLTVADRSMLRRYCEVTARHEVEVANVRREGSVVTGGAGGPIVSPHMKIVQACELLLTQLEREFGMSPSSRAKVQMAKKPKPKANKFGALRVVKGGNDQ